MATIMQLQWARVIIGVLIVINVIITITLIYAVDIENYYYWGYYVSGLVFMVLALAGATVSVLIQRKVRAMATSGPATVLTVPAGWTGPPPAPGLAAVGQSQPQGYGQSAFAQPAAYGQTAAYGQPSSYGQTAFAQPSPAGGQPFAAFNQSGQDGYWNPAQTK